MTSTDANELKDLRERLRYELLEARKVSNQRPEWAKRQLTSITTTFTVNETGSIIASR